MNRFLTPALFALPALLSAQTSRGTCAAPFAVALSDEHRVSMHLRAGDIEIAPSAKQTLTVTCRVNDDAQDRIKISFAANNLRISGGPDNNVRFRIEVPPRTNLLVRVTAGDVTVSGITGDKDIQLRAGDLTILIDRPEEYRVAEGSLMAGDISAPAFGVTKDGLFRSFRKENPNGRYRLHAELLAGDLTLK